MDRKLLEDMFGNPVGEFQGVGGETSKASTAKEQEMLLKFHQGRELEVPVSDDTGPVKPEDLSTHF